MTKTFYTNVLCFGSKILYRGVENGRKVRNRVEYHPTLYVPSKTRTKFTTVTGEFVSEIKPGTIPECRDFVKKYEGIDNFKIYGNQKYEYTYISDTHPGDVEWEKSYINICNIDIEVGNNHYASNPQKKVRIRKKK